MWNIEKLLVMKIRVNVVHTFFPNLEEMERILKLGPWCFNNDLLALQHWERTKEFRDKSFKENIEKLRVMKIRVNVVHIFFPNLEEMERILKLGPWCFNNDLLALQHWERMKEFTDKYFKEVSFWIHISSLLVECFTKEMGLKLVDRFGRSTDIQIREFTEDEGHILKNCAEAPKDISEEEQEDLRYDSLLAVDYEKSVSSASCSSKVDMEWEKKTSGLIGSSLMGNVQIEEKGQPSKGNGSSRKRKKFKKTPHSSSVDRMEEA
ncbi:hypothetical protein M9H77_23276 [Catharanthus roseus]|uniref:Uncharacterized protein n=1 Tax=Catharanthus roseus TaxID=4058 RepID=A0ACC0AWX7_CATRO|nr:hypothetical protein M9H77_23276 [Catharanthus roseus]